MTYPTTKLEKSKFVREKQVSYLLSLIAHARKGSPLPDSLSVEMNLAWVTKFEDPQKALSDLRDIRLRALDQQKNEVAQLCLQMMIPLLNLVGESGSFEASFGIPARTETPFLRGAVEEFSGRHDQAAAEYAQALEDAHKEGDTEGALRAKSALGRLSRKGGGNG